MVNNSELQHAVGIFATREDAEAALTELRDTGFNMDKVSVIAQNVESEPNLGGAEVKSSKEQAEEGAKVGVTAGAATGGFLGLIGGLAVLTFPGVGAAAEVGAVLANTLLGGGVGAAGGGLIGALIGWGIPEERAKYFNNLVSQGHYIVLLEGTTTEVDSAEAILKRRNMNHWGVYGVPMAHPNTSMGIV